ncbi:autotransporter (plasmid) [Fusobacterium varium]|nr:autotransporter [Fusobacterium varium]
MKRKEIEKSLKRFLKKKISYSFSLLISFLITGEIAIGTEANYENIKKEKKELLTKIKIEKEEIKEKIRENEKIIKEYNYDFIELIRKGNFYSKPTFSSNQIFFSNEFLHNGKSKNRTKKEFAETIQAVNEYFGMQNSKLNKRNKNELNIAMDKILSGNGVVIDDSQYKETIFLGPNIKPIEVGFPNISPEISVNVSLPNINLGSFPTTISPTLITMPTITVVTPTMPITPSGVNVVVSTPSHVEKIEISTPVVQTPTTPSDKNIIINSPTVPAGFEPTTIVTPTAPNIPVIVPPIMPSFASNVVSGGNGTANHIDTSTWSNGVIEMVAITGGNFNLVRNTANTWTYNYSGYNGANVWAIGNATSDLHPAVAVNGTWSNLSRSSTVSNNSQLGFQKLVGSATQSTMLSNATFLYTRGMESSTANLGEFVHMDIHGSADPAGQRAGLVIGTAGLSNQNAILAAYDDAGDNINWTYEIAKNTTAASSRYTWINSGKIVIEGGNTSLTNHYDHSSAGRKAIAMNTGEVIFQPYYDGTNYFQKYTSAFVMSLSGTGVHHIMYNGETGKIKTYTGTASIFLSGSSGSNRPLSIVNRGILEMYGQNSAGIYLKTGSDNDLYFASQDFVFNTASNTITAGSYKPLKLFGDSSIGLYGVATAGSTIGNFAVDIGEVGKGNQNFTTSTASGSTNGTNLVDYNINSSGANSNIEGTFGVIANAAMNLTSHQIRIYDKTEKNVGVYPNADIALNIGGGEITLNGGNSNTGILINGKGSVTSTGNISLINGIGNMAVYVKGASSGLAEAVTVNKITAANTEDSVVVYGESGAKITANELNVVSKVGANPTTVNGKDTGAAFASGANTIITFNRATTPATANIDITGSKLDDADRYVGFGVMATGGGVVNAKNNYIKVINGSTAAASIGTNSNIDLSGGTVEFDGSGYAVYSDGVGKINLSNSKMILRGKATAFDIDMLAGTPPVTLDANSRIHVESNDVIVFSLKNVTGLSTSGLETNVIGTIGAALGGINLSNLINASLGIDKYKIAAVDGGTINIGNLDKTGVGTIGETQAQQDGNFYYNRFLGQRLVATATGSTISAVLNNTQAAKFNNQVVGLEMNSSKLATSNAEAGINLVNSTIIADRDGSGSGAIGAFINYGVVTVDGTSSIKVEKESNAANAQAVGIYAVNGSKVSNDGNIEVGGNQSIGILGMAYREDSSSTPIVNEFGLSAVGQGKASIINSNKIILDGTGAVGIYAYNNNALGTKVDVTVTNTAAGEIKVGHSSGANAAIGIYGDKATISNLGKISVGDGGVAIYAKNGTEITNLGTLDLGADAIGVMLDGTSDLTATTVTLTSNNTGTLGKTGIFYKGTGAETKTVVTSVDASDFDKGIAIYTEDINITSSNNILNIGKDGVGIFVKGNINNTGTNEGTINLASLKTDAVGMYTKTSNILNNTTGVINVNDITQVGMYAEGINAKAINKGTINLNTDGATGIYIKSGAATELDTGNNIVFNGKSSIGVFAENSSVDFKDSLTLSSTNENKNIFAYGKGAVVDIAPGKTVTVDGVVMAVTPGNKTVGIYLENAGAASTFNGTTGQLAVINEAVGIYSKENNTLNVNVTADGEKTTGIFIDGASTISGTVAATGSTTAGAVGVYGNGGVVTIGTGGLILNTNVGKGTGMYLTDGASAAGGTITVNNTVTGTKNIGVYYSKGTVAGTVTNNSAISLIGSESIGIYAADGITLVNNTNITSAAGQSDSIASYVGENSQLTSTGIITMNDNNSIGMYIEEGKGINSGTIAMNGTASSTTKSVVGMVAEAKMGKTATAENAAGGTILAGTNLGMYIGGSGTSSGTNAGTITTTTGTGVYVDGSGNTFNGTGGIIASDAVGIYLKDTIANTVANTGILNITSGGVGIFGKNANIDFTVNVAGTGAVGVAAETNSIISGNVTTGMGSTGVFLLDDTVTFNGAVIETGISVPESAPGLNDAKTSVGILFHTGITGTYNMSNVSVNAKNGVGIYLDGTGMTLNHNGNVTTEDGIGIYVPTGTTLATGTSTMNINGGTGVYVDGGLANLGTTGNLTFNFGTGGGIGVFNDGGTLNLGNNITVTGSGSLAATSNGSLNSAGNLNIGTAAVGLLGKYDSNLISSQTLSNNGNITVISGGIGIAATLGNSIPTHLVTINNIGTINVSGISNISAPSIGIYTETADIVNTGNINVGNSGIGIYSNHNGVMTSVQNNNMTMTGTGGIGVYIKGATNGLTVNNITSTDSNNTGVVLEGVISNINIGTVALRNESVGVMATSGTGSTINGTITVGDSSTSKSAIGVVANTASNVTLAGTTTVTAGTGGIGVYAEGAGTIVTVANTANITVGTDGIYMYSKDATLNFSGNITANNQIGIVADGGTINAMGASTITVQNGGIGAYVKNSSPIFNGTTINIQAGNISKYTTGIYYQNVSTLGTLPVINQTGDYSIGMILDNSSIITNSLISIGNNNTNQVAKMIKNSSNFTSNNIIQVNGDKNIGIYGSESLLNIGTVQVGASSYSANKENSSIGVYLKDGKYLGNNSIIVGNNSIGIFGEDITTGNYIRYSGNSLVVGNNALGIYAAGTGQGSKDLTVTTTNGITIANDGAIGIFAKNIDSSINSNISVGTGTSVGIASEGNGNLHYNGTLSIANKGNSTGSIGIYKVNGSGTVTTNGVFNIGEGGYGIYLKQSDPDSSVILNNNSNIILGEAAVGIYSSGNNIVNNNANITVGTTYLGPNGDHDQVNSHFNSIGIYLANNSKGENTGTINIINDHSLGVFGIGKGTTFTNKGTINIDNGAMGILVREGAIAINEVGSHINIGNLKPICLTPSIGMAAYNGGEIYNKGTITVNEGIGMTVNEGSVLSNTGTIYVNNGIGIQGNGIIYNNGQIIVTGSGSDITLGGPPANIGSIIIDSNGNITINGNYVAVGGTLTTTGSIIVNGAYVDVTTGIPMFNSANVNGEVNILPNFAMTGNGISYEIKGFLSTAAGTIDESKLTPIISPLFVAKVSNNGDLIIVKRPYADLTIGSQFDAMDKGLDNILANSGGEGKDAEILKGLNTYLAGLSKEEFKEEASKKIAEFRGDIYATIQGRMQDINKAFSNSFYELESSYNLTKDSSKYSVIYTDGNYKDPTVGIDDYDYKIMGILYMKEKEGTEYGSKYGYTLGFAGSKFKFDDGGSKEDVYSLRAGTHRIKNLNDEYKISWLSRVELGYNRHIAKRKLNLHETFENKGEYNTYSVAFDNRITKVIYTDLSKQLDVYADLDLEYGKIDGFKESSGSKGGLELQIKSNDYLSAQIGAGVKASQRIYTVNDISVKVTADVKYAYEFGDNYDGNKAKLKNGGEGYYSLITPEEKEGKLTGKVGLTLEKANHMGMTFEIEAMDESNKQDSSIKYGVRFNYKF